MKEQEQNLDIKSCASSLAENILKIKNLNK